MANATPRKFFAERPGASGTCSKRGLHAGFHSTAPVTSQPHSCRDLLGLPTLCVLSHDLDEGSLPTIPMRTRLLDQVANALHVYIDVVQSQPPSRIVDLLLLLSYPTLRLLSTDQQHDRQHGHARMTRTSMWSFDVRDCPDFAT